MTQTITMQPYPAYKPSNIDWIGEIPSHWEVVNFKHKITILTDFTANGSFASLADNVEYLEEGFSRLVRLTDLRVNFENQGIYITEDAHNFLSKSELFGGELLIANVGAYAGLVIIMPETGQKMTLAPNMFMLRLNSNTKFYFYLLNSEEFKNHISMLAVSSAQPKLNKDNIKSLRIVSLPLQEQQAIVKYLDQKTTLIDELIAKKTQHIALLQEQRTALINHAVTKGLNDEVEMKDSGIEWIGEIPSHWGGKLLKYVADKIDEPPVSKGLLFAVENIESHTGKLVGLDKELEYEGAIAGFKEGDTIFNKLRPYLAKVYYAECSGGYFGELLTIRGKKGVFSKYLYRILSSRGFLEIVNSSSEGTKMPRANWETSIKLITVPLPPISEQQAIVAYLDEQTALIDKIIAVETQYIASLKEYRQSLISAVVTGKVCVLD